MSGIKSRSYLKSLLSLVELKSQLLSSQSQSNGFSFLTSALSTAHRLRQAGGLPSCGVCPTYLRVVFPHWWELTDFSDLPPGITVLCGLQLGSVLYQGEPMRGVISMKNRKEQQNEQGKTRSELKNERRICVLWWGLIWEQGSCQPALSKVRKNPMKNVCFRCGHQMTLVD